MKNNTPTRPTDPDWPEKLDPRRAEYPSDLSEQQWRGIDPLVTSNSALGRPRQHAVRDVVDALNYRWETGCSWRMLPHDFPPWTTVYSYFRRWQRQGILRQIRAQLLRPQSVVRKRQSVVDHQLARALADFPQTLPFETTQLPADRDFPVH